MLELSEENGGPLVRGNEYALEIRPDLPGRFAMRVGGEPAVAGWIAGVCDADGTRDSIAGLGEPEAQRLQDVIEIKITAQSTLWGKVSYHFRASAEGIEHFGVRHGRRTIDDLQFLATRDPSGEIRMSDAYWRKVFDPEPNARRKHFFLPRERATIGITSDIGYYRGNWLFTPGPYCYVVELPSGRWLSAGLAVAPGQNNFDHFEYRGSDAGFCFDIRYGGHVQTSEEWESPHLTLLPADGAHSGIGAYCARLRRAGLTREARGRQYEWWWEPIACGWGEQVAMERRTFVAPPAIAAADHCTQSNYGRFVRTWEEHGLNPGTLVIDDKWQDQYGLNGVNRQKWPDLPGFVAAQHAMGRKVLLWLRAWHSEGVPLEECLLNAAGEPLAVDPSAPGYVARLRQQVRHMIRDLDADGFKVDFTHSLPSEEGVVSARGIWGLELLRTLVQTIHDEAKQAKPDALIMAHTANPYFVDIVDMLRLNDIGNGIGEPSYLASMMQRKLVAKAVSARWIIDTDNWPSPNRAAWREYCAAQPQLGVPSLYYASRIYFLADNGEVSDEPLRREDYQAIAESWAKYRRERAGRDLN